MRRNTAAATQWGKRGREGKERVKKVKRKKGKGEKEKGKGKKEREKKKHEEKRYGLCRTLTEERSKEGKLCIIIT
jgi:predicted DNA-binding WGR domain protein